MVSKTERKQINAIILNRKFCCLVSGISWKFYVSYTTTYPYNESTSFKDNSNAQTNSTQKPAEEMTVDELGISRGVCVNDFYDLTQRLDSFICFSDDEFILHLLPASKSDDVVRKPFTMVKCIDDHPILSNGSNHLRIMKNVREIMALLKPIGNATKTYESGSCVLVYFYTNSCKMCQMMDVPVMVLPNVFKTLPVLAVDAYKFNNFNTDFGIVGLPTLILFHQGRPAVRKPWNIKLRAFITRHTGLKPDIPTFPLNIAPITVFEQKTDYILIMAWSFISICVGYYVSKTFIYNQFVEMVKRNWRETEAHLEHN